MVKFLFFLVLLVSCVHSEEHPEYGIQPGHESFIPARIAVINCRDWPNDARYKGLPASSVAEPIRTELCEEMDRFVIAGFQGQPYMKGYSPNAVRKLLAAPGAKTVLEKFDDLWIRQSGDCFTCENPTDYYRSSIAERHEWRLWLHKFSRDVRHADAVLIPFLLFADQTEIDDRGIKAALRNAGITLLLIRTGDGSLIWAGGREAEARNQSDPEIPDAKVEMPSWQNVHTRLFTDDLWRGFPGRQVY